MKWIRWKGIIAFVAIVGLLVVFFKFYAGTVVEKVIEAAGSKAVGAKVELADVDLSLVPLGITLKGLQVTDPDEPMTNLFEVADTRLSLEPGNLLLKKVIVDEMTVTGIRIKTARQTSGALLEREKKDKIKKEAGKGEGKTMAMPSFDIPDIKDVLAKEPLAVVEEADALKQEMADFKKDVEARIKTLPDKDTFKGYEARVKELKPKKLSFGSLLGKVEELKQVKKDINGDMDAITSLKGDVKSKVDDFKKRIAQLPGKAKEDAQRLKTKYAPNPQSLGNVSALFFGAKTSAWVTKGLSLYRKIKPYLSKDGEANAEKDKGETPAYRAKGVDVPFKEEHPVPDFLIRHASLSVILDSGTLSGEIENVTNQQPINGKPITIAFESTKLEGMEGFRLNGIIDRVKKGQEKDSLTASVEGYGLNAMNLAEKSPMGIRIDHAMVRGDLDLIITDNQLDGTMAAALSPVAVSPVGEAGNERLKKALGQSLADVKSLNVKGSLSGQLPGYNMELSSDLDQILKKTVSDMVKTLADDFSKELQAAIQEKAQGQVASLTGDVDLFSPVDRDLDERLNLGKNVLKGI